MRCTGLIEPKPPPGSPVKDPLSLLIPAGKPLLLSAGAGVHTSVEEMAYHVSSSSETESQYDPFEETPCDRNEDAIGEETPGDRNEEVTGHKEGDADAAAESGSDSEGGSPPSPLYAVGQASSTSKPVEVADIVKIAGAVSGAEEPRLRPNPVPMADFTRTEDLFAKDVYSGVRLPLPAAEVGASEPLRELRAILFSGQCDLPVRPRAAMCSGASA